jgi:hypothetical protein
MIIKAESVPESQDSFGHHFYSQKKHFSESPIPAHGETRRVPLARSVSKEQELVCERPLDSIVLNCNTRDKVLKYNRSKLTRDLKDALTVNGILEKQAVKTCLKKSVSGATEVEIHVPKNSSKVTLKQVHTCKNFWQCPCCRTHALNKKRESVQTVIDRTMTDNFMVTLTLRHNKNDRLKGLVDGLQKASSDLWRDRHWLRLKKEYKFLWNVRNLEVTWSEKNGWHSHIHLLIGSSEANTISDLDTIQYQLFDVWNRLVQKHGLKGLDRQAGVKVTPADNADDYLVKWSISKEMSSDKSGKKGHLSMGDIEIEVLCHTIDSKHKGRVSIHQARKILQEYYEAFDKRKFLQPGGKFNEILRGETEDSVERDFENEEDVLHDEKQESDKSIIYVKGHLWSKLCYSGWGFSFLSKLEQLEIPEAMTWLASKWNNEEILDGIRIEEWNEEVHDPTEGTRP